MLRVMGGGGAFSTAGGGDYALTLPRSVSTHPNSRYVIIGITHNTQRHQSSDHSLEHRRLILGSRGRCQGMLRTHAMASLALKEKVDTASEKQIVLPWVARKSNGKPLSTYQTRTSSNWRSAPQGKPVERESRWTPVSERG